MYCLIACENLFNSLRFYSQRTIAENTISEYQREAPEGRYVDRKCVPQG